MHLGAILLNIDRKKRHRIDMFPRQNAKNIEGNRYLLGDDTFCFECHSKLACFTHCCHNADMYLYPYDIIRLKRRLGMTSEAFLERHTITALRDMPHFPNVMLKMSDRPGNPCTFLSEAGCSVYEDRPYACRAYPLEPAMYGDEGGQTNLHCYVVRHGHCLGHRQKRTWTARQWMADQQMTAYNEINARWARIASRFQNNPFGPRGIDSPAMKMTFMASYNMDTFRRFVFDSSFLSKFDLLPERLAAIRDSDSELLLLGFDWIARFLFGDGPLRQKDRQER